MPVKNSGGVISRGFSEFSRIITRGFGKCFRTQVFKLKKKKEPIYREFTFEIYSPVSKELEIKKTIQIPFIKRLILNYLIKQKIKLNYQINNNVSESIEQEYSMTFKLDNRKLINILNVLETWLKYLNLHQYLISNIQILARIIKK